jgi:imidazolonepropionase-like amidohydrolase
MKRRQFLQGVAGATLVGVPSLSSRAAAQGQALVRVWTDATIWLGDGEVIEGGMLVTTGERISAVSKPGPVPPDAVVMNAAGSIITPGWVATETPLGLVEIELEPSTVDSHPRRDERSDSIRAGQSAADGYNPMSTLLAVARRAGVTSCVSTPDGGLVSGTSAWVDLLDHFPASPTVPTPIVREDIALHANVSELADATRPFALSRLREALQSARLYSRSPDAYDRGQTRDLELSVSELDRLSRVFGGGLPLVVKVSRGTDILRLLSLAKGYALKLILSGVEEGWTVATQIAAARVPVILEPTRNLPSSFASVNTRRENAALLSEAGVNVIISTFDAHGAHNLRQLAGNAVAYGLSRRAALRALSFEPAAAFGMAQNYGLLAPGKVANFSVWNGDPFELGTWASHVVVRGAPASTRSRQDALFERYRDLGQVPRGRSSGTGPKTSS